MNVTQPPAALMKVVYKPIPVMNANRTTNVLPILAIQNAVANKNP
jgi:hypothetical protein